MTRVRGLRPPWISLPGYGVMLVVIILDMRSVIFWAEVDGSLGALLAILSAVVASLVVILIVVDIQYQLALRRENRA